jgi:hypothetical protein
MAIALDFTKTESASFIVANAFKRWRRDCGNGWKSRRPRARRPGSIRDEGGPLRIGD